MAVFLLSSQSLRTELPVATDIVSPIHICLINQKGGCGKSSTCFHLAGSLAALGKSVLLIDADPQGSISQAFLGPEVVERLDPEQTLAAVVLSLLHM